MVHRIFRSILSAAIVTLLACLVIITGILYRHSAEEQHTQLGNQLVADFRQFFDFLVLKNKQWDDALYVPR